MLILGAHRKTSAPTEVASNEQNCCSVTFQIPVDHVWPSEKWSLELVLFSGFIKEVIIPAVERSRQSEIKWCLQLKLRKALQPFTASAVFCFVFSSYFQKWKALFPLFSSHTSTKHRGSLLFIYIKVNSPSSVLLWLSVLSAWFRRIAEAFSKCLICEEDQRGKKQKLYKNFNNFQQLI